MTTILITDTETNKSYSVPGYDIVVCKRYDGSTATLRIEIVCSGVVLFSKIDAYCGNSEVVEFIERMMLFYISSDPSRFTISLSEDIGKEKVREVVVKLQKEYFEKGLDSPAFATEYGSHVRAFGIVLEALGISFPPTP